MNKKDLVLQTLSFYEPLAIARIVIDMDKSELKSMENFSIDELEVILGDLVKEKIVKCEGSENDRTYIKIFPRKKNFLKRWIDRLLRSL